VTGPERDIERYNRAFYERCWRAGTVLPLPGVQPAPAERALVELGSGLRPRLPIDDAVFLDLSLTACAKLARTGARAICGSAAALPFRTGALGAVHAYDLLEHIDDDVGAVRELARVIGPGGRLVVSTPLHEGRWQPFDRVVGHARRYAPEALVTLLVARGFVLDGFAPFGLRPQSRLLNRLGVYYLTRWPRLALWCEERFLRLAGKTDRVLVVRRADEATFLREAVNLDGALTVWRRADGAPTSPRSFASLQVAGSSSKPT
jgi:SAM-dependent methyltransferase